MKNIKIKLITFVLVVTFLGITTVAYAEDVIPTEDLTPPVIALMGEPNISITQGEEYVDEGATAEDDTDGDITSNIIVENAVDVSTVGTYTVSYSTTDLAGNRAEITRTVEVSAPLEPAVSIHLNVQTSDGIIYDQEIEVTPCDSEGNGVMKATPYCALEQAEISSDWSGLWVNSIDGIVNNENDNGVYWMWLANLDTDYTDPESSYNLSPKQYELNADDNILFHYGINPLNISASDLNPVVGESITITVTKLGLDDSWNPAWNSAVSGKVAIGSDIFDLDEEGRYSLLVSNEEPFTIEGQLSGFIDTPLITITPTVPTLPATIDIALKIYSGNTILFDGPKTVTACAESPETDAPITINGKCAIEQSGLSNTWTWYDDNFHTVSDLPKTLGILDELGGTASDNVNYIYWGWFSDLNYGSVALNKHPLHSNEELLLTYNSYPLRLSASSSSSIIGDTTTFLVEEKSSFSADYFDMVWTPSSGATVTLGTQSCATIADGTCSIVLDTVGSLNAVGSKTLYVPTTNIGITVSAGQNNGGGGNVPPAPTFSATDAINYLKSVQGADGSFGDSDLYTDWAAIAYGSGNVSGSYRDSLLEYFISHNSISSLITDNERRTMALLSLGKNPYSWNAVNYIEAIVDGFDGTQFGDEDLINDDIFALIPLGNVGYTENDEIIAKTVTFIISKQQADGSWEGSVDITAAAIQALKSFDSISNISNALTNAGNYLANTQGGDGGWGNISSTSWAMQAENALNASWTKNGKSGLDYLAIMQTNADNDGAILPSSEISQNIIWTTSYAIPAGLGKPWSEIMEHVSKPNNKDNSSGASRNADKHKDNNTETEETTLQNSEIEPLTIAPVVEEKIDQITKNKKLPIPPQKDSLLNTEKNEKITPPIFTATAINALPPQTSGIPQNIPIILGTLSGIILLYAVLKFFAIF
jgi:hypothetical protein